jgi:hypothetical protein
MSAALIAAIDFQDPSTKWVLIAGAILVVTYLATRNKTKNKDPLERKQAAANEGAAPKVSLAQQRALERDMSQLVTELMEMARQMTAQMETRAAKLDLLMREADEKMTRLQTLLDAAERADVRGNGNGSLHSPDSPLPSASLSLPSPEPSTRHQQIYALAEQGRTAHQIAQELGRQDSEVEMILALRPRPQ